jgi:hypothetical protein
VVRVRAVEINQKRVAVGKKKEREAHATVTFRAVPVIWSTKPRHVTGLKPTQMYEADSRSVRLLAHQPVVSDSTCTERIAFAARPPSTDRTVMIYAHPTPPRPGFLFTVGGRVVRGCRVGPCGRRANGQTDERIRSSIPSRPGQARKSSRTGDWSSFLHSRAEEDCIFASQQVLLFSTLF